MRTTGDSVIKSQSGLCAVCSLPFTTAAMRPTCPRCSSRDIRFPYTNAGKPKAASVKVLPLYVVVEDIPSLKRSFSPWVSGYSVVLLHLGCFASRSAARKALATELERLGNVPQLRSKLRVIPLKRG